MRNGCKNMNNEHNSSQPIRPAWWKETIVYQIYPRSFQDSNGDGIGDLQGIIQRLDYVAGLGVETIWLNPIFQSPNDDNGYDVSDYRAIMDDFGTMKDFEELLAGMKKRGLKIILDLVPNHSSDEHIWFVESRKSKDNPYRDYYFWRPARPDGSPPNNWVSYFAPSAWQWDEKTGEYYLHLFSVKQPDLNWENPKVREEIYSIMHFWLDKGIDGFRIDVLPFLSKNLDFPDYPADFDGNLGRFYANGPRLHEFLQEMNREVLSKYPCMTVGEGPGISPDQALLYVQEDRHELNTIYYFDHMDLDRDPFNMLRPAPWDLVAFKKVYADWDAVVKSGGWNTVFLGNHDFPRIVSRWGNDRAYRRESAKLLAMLLLTQRGTPYLYQGDEIGMTNVSWTDLSKYNDLQIFNNHKEWLKAGGDEAEFLSWLPHTSRDNARTPFQWDDTANAGFTDGKPWLELNPNYLEINVKQAEQEQSSILHFYKKMIHLRRSTPLLTYGDYRDLLPEHPAVFSYTRSTEAETWLVILNFSNTQQELFLPEGIKIRELILGNYENVDLAQPLYPWEARLCNIDPS